MLFKKKQHGTRGLKNFVSFFFLSLGWPWKGENFGHNLFCRDLLNLDLLILDFEQDSVKFDEPWEDHQCLPINFKCMRHEWHRLQNDFCRIRYEIVEPCHSLHFLLANF